jgi:hypothetical protein
LPLLPFHSVSTFAPFRLAERYAPLFTVRHEKTFLFHLTQHALALYRLAKAFEQILLRLA